MALLQALNDKSQTSLCPQAHILVLHLVLLADHVDAVLARMVIAFTQCLDLVQFPLQAYLSCLWLA